MARLFDRCTIWAATPLEEITDGIPQGGNTNLRELPCVNIQYMSNEMEQRTFGQVTNRMITLDFLSAPDLRKGDVLYMAKPEKRGVFTVEGNTYDDYGPGDYEIQSLVPSRFGGRYIRNPTVVTARKLVGDD